MVTSDVASKTFFCVRPQSRKQKYFSLTFVGGCYLKMHLHVAVSPLNVGIEYVGENHDGGEGVLWVDGGMKIETIEVFLCLLNELNNDNSCSLM